MKRAYKIIALAVLAASLVALGITQRFLSSAPRTECLFDPSKRTITFSGVSESLTLSRAVGTIRVNGSDCISSERGAKRATLDNAKLAKIELTAPERTARPEFVLDMTSGPFATQESSGDELKVELTSKDPRFSIRILGSTGPDHVVIGEKGIDFTGDGDLDVSVRSVRGFILDLKAGDDAMSANGGGGTGGPATARVSFHGGRGNDKLIGGPLDDSLFGEEGDDTISGGKGQDVASYEKAPDSVIADLISGSVTGGHGNDTLSEIEGIIGSPFGDRILGNERDNVLDGGRGDDVVLAGEGNDTLSGDEGNDELDGGLGVDRILFATARQGVKVNLAAGVASGAGNDRLISIENVIGSSFDDDLQGDNSPNRLDGRLGHDRLSGGPGSDRLIGGVGDDYLDGGPGVDKADFLDSTKPLFANLARGLAQGNGDDQLVSIESLIGTPFDDELIGDDQTNVIEGLQGNDVIVGGPGNDQLDGGEGDDRLDGGLGTDSMDGGPGSDTCETREKTANCESVSNG